MTSLSCTASIQYVLQVAGLFGPVICMDSQGAGFSEPNAPALTHTFTRFMHTQTCE